MKKVAITLGILIILLGGFLVYRYMRPSAIVLVPSSGENAKDEAWSVFERYMAGAKIHDLNTVKSLSYQVSPICADPAKRAECNKLMDNVYNFSTFFKEAEFTHALSDKKQTILYTDYTEDLHGSLPNSTRKILYFARDNTGELKFLSLNPLQGPYLVRRAKEATSTIESGLKEGIKDSDGDTLSDQEELCMGPTAGADCTKTDPLNPDTNGNGWWDSIEKFFYK